MGGALLAYGVVLIYVFRSGVMGVGWTNTFQGIFMMALAWGLGLYLPHRLYGGVGPMFAAIAKAAPKMLEAPGLGADGHPWTWGAYSSAVAISVLGFGVWPHTFMKIYTARSERTLKRTIVWYPTFQMFLVPILFIGFSGILAFPGVNPADKILPTVVTSIGLPPVVVGLFCAGALAASMSTGDALLHAAASVTIKDLWRPLFRPDLAGDTERRLIRDVRGPHRSPGVRAGHLAATCPWSRCSSSRTASSRSSSRSCARPSCGPGPRARAPWRGCWRASWSR